MKRLMIFLAAVLPFLVACNKQNPTTGDPSITWESNPSFAQKEMTEDLDAVVSVSAPGQIDALTITLGLGDYAVLANPYIKIAANKGNAGKSPVMDVIDDSSVAAFLSGLGMQAGPSLRGKDQVSLDLVKILETIIAGQLVENNTLFSMDVSVTDEAGNTARRIARFHYTVAPEFNWTANPSFSLINLNDSPVDTKISIWAPGRVAKLAIRLEDGAAPELSNFVKNRTTGQTTVIDLVEDPLVADTFKGYFPAGSAVKDRTDLVLDFSFMYGIKYDLSASTNIFTIVVVDQLGKEVSTQVKFKK